MNNKNEEQGFALVMTMAILVGMLIIITPLVLINNQRTKEAKSFEAEALAQYGLETGKNLTAFVNRHNGANALPSIAKRLMLPGWKNIPLKLHSSGGSGISNMLPAFLMMAEPLGPLTTDVKYTDDAPAVSAAAPAHVGWIMIGGELIGANAGDRCLAGVRSAHAEGAMVYGLKSLNNIKAWVRVEDGDWEPAGAWTLTNTFDGSIGGVGGTAGGIVEFSPAPIHDLITPGVANSDNLMQLDVNITVVDEGSKININTAPDAVLTALDLDSNLNSNPPYVSPGAMRAGATDEQKLAITGSKHILTTYSYPDYSMNVNFADAVHSLNVNTSTVNVLGRAFIAMGMGDAAAYDLAGDIIAYRSGKVKDANKAGYFDGEENPFDGRDGNEYYLSPADEFKAFIEVNAAGDLERIMRHVYVFSSDVNYDGLNPKAMPLAFEADDAQTAMISARVMAGIKPIIEKSIAVSSRDLRNNYMDDNGDLAEIVIDHAHNWNSKNSTMENLEWRPVEVQGMAGTRVNFVFDPNNNNYVIPDSATFNVGMVGFKEDSHFKIKYFSEYAAGRIQAEIEGTAPQADDLIDFGLRIKVNTAQMQLVNEHTLFGTNAGFSVDTANNPPNNPGGTPVLNNTLLINDLIEVPPGRWLAYYELAGAPNQTNPVYVQYTGGGGAQYRATVGGFNADNAGTALIPGNADDPATPMIDESTDDTPAVMPDQNKAHIIPNYVVDTLRPLYPYDPAAPPANAPYFETIVDKEGAQFAELEWWTTDSTVGLKNGAANNTVLLNGGAVGAVATRVDGEIAKHKVAINGNDKITLRFNFNTLAAAPYSPEDGSPQLFKIIVRYKIDGNLSPRIVLDQR